MEVTRLKDLQIGEEAEILGYATCDPAYRNKLLSLGLTKATRIRLIQKAPLGDPVEIEVRGFRLSLRKDEADVILLKKINGKTYEEQELPGKLGEGLHALGKGPNPQKKGPGPHRKRFRWGLRRFLHDHFFL